MKIVSIFDDHIYSIEYDGSNEHELSNLFEKWNDTEFLYNFFIENKPDLDNPIWENITVQEAIFTTIEEASELEQMFMDEKLCHNLMHKFKPLTRDSVHNEDYQKNKLYGPFKPSWLRIYAIRMDSDCYIITGGAIKLTKSMDMRTHTKMELNKLERVRDFLIENGICDNIGINDFIEF